MLTGDERAPDGLERRRRFVAQAGQGRPRWRQGRIDPEPDGGRRTPTLTPGSPAAAGGGRRPGSRLLHRLGDVTAYATAGLLVAAAVLCWLAAGLALGFPSWWDNTLYVVSSSITLVMVFAIQHTQAREQSVTQRKLDELLRATPTADNRLIAVEEAPDAELEALAELNLTDREQA